MKAKWSAKCKKKIKSPPNNLDSEIVKLWTNELFDHKAADFTIDERAFTIDERMFESSEVFNT